MCIQNSTILASCPQCFSRKFLSRLLFSVRMTQKMPCWLAFQADGLTADSFRKSCLGPALVSVEVDVQCKARTRKWISSTQSGGVTIKIWQQYPVLFTFLLGFGGWFFFFKKKNSGLQFPDPDPLVEMGQDLPSTTVVGAVVVRTSLDRCHPGRPGRGHGCSRRRHSRDGWMDGWRWRAGRKWENPLRFVWKLGAFVLWLSAKDFFWGLFWKKNQQRSREEDSIGQFDVLLCWSVSIFRLLEIAWALGDLQYISKPILYK